MGCNCAKQLDNHVEYENQKRLAQIEANYDKKGYYIYGTQTQNGVRYNYTPTITSVPDGAIYTEYIAW